MPYPMQCPACGHRFVFDAENEPCEKQVYDEAGQTVVEFTVSCPNCPNKVRYTFRGHRWERQERPG